MLSVLDFDRKGTISKVRVHVGARFGHTACRSIAKCSFSSKFSKLFDHHGKIKREMYKKMFSKRKKPELPRISARNIVERVIDVKTSTLNSQAVQQSGNRIGKTLEISSCTIMYHSKSALQ